MLICTAKAPHLFLPKIGNEFSFNAFENFEVSQTKDTKRMHCDAVRRLSFRTDISKIKLEKLISAFQKTLFSMLLSLPFYINND